MNLLRDDLGTNSDPAALREPVQPGRSAGRIHDQPAPLPQSPDTFPVPVDVTVRCSADTKGARNVVNTKVQLNKEGEEVDGASAWMNSATWRRTR